MNGSRNTILGVRFTESERRLLADAARKIHPELKASQWVRQAAIAALAKQAKDRSEPTAKAG